jgi:phospholipid-binding lipoprotein MlaA
MRVVPFHRLTLVHRVALAALLISGVLAGCATPPPADDPDAVADFKETNDPLEPTNRVFYDVNDALDTVLLRPLAKGYHYVVPEPVRNGVHNALGNLDTPVELADDMLAGKSRRAGDTTMRFLINTTVGLGGIFDVAEDWGYPAHDTDFGMTMASWGTPPGPFLYLPVLGPTDPRDVAGFGTDIAIDPFTWIGNGQTVSILGWTRYGVSAIDARERVLDPVDQIKKTALDPYATFRSLYRQHRQGQIDKMRDDNRATIPIWYAQPATPAH